jgi:hypothetical protein
MLVTANILPSSLISFTLMKEAICFYKSQFLQEQHSVTPQKMTFIKPLAARQDLFNLRMINFIMGVEIAQLVQWWAG